MEHLDQLSNPILRDWSIIISGSAAFLFLVIKWLVGVITKYQEQSRKNRNEDASKIETFLDKELNISRAEKAELSKELNRLNAEGLVQARENSKLKLHVRALITRVRYLEKLLYENNIQFIPAVENYDD